MSYYNTNFYSSPKTYESSDMDEPVPGWGLSPIAYANSRVGVGAMVAMKKMDARAMTMSKIGTTPRAASIDTPTEIGTIPWYVWIGGSVAVVGLAGFAYYSGWLG